MDKFSDEEKRWYRWKASADYNVRITAVPEAESEGKWDWKVTVSKDGVSLSDLVSGGHYTAECVANRLMRELDRRTA